MVTSRFVAPAVVCGLFFLLAAPVLAQEATPAASPAATAGDVDLAAMALSAEDIP